PYHFAYPCLLFFFHCSLYHRDLHSFPTRRSSDLVGSTIVADKLRNSRADGLTVIAALLREHESDLADYLVHDEIGRQLPMLIQRSEEHTSELQSQSNLVCRLLLEKKKKKQKKKEN